MTKKIIEKKDFLINFLKKHKSFSIVVAIGIMFMILPLVFTKIMAGDEDINLQLKDSALENSETNPYIIDSVDDFIVLQEYSKTHDCYGMYFAVGDILKNNRLTYSPDEEEDEEGSEASGITYNLNLVGTIVLEDGSRTQFIGIGQNYALPFRGNILFNGITIRTDTPLFCFIGSGASIEEVHLFGDVIADKFHTIVTKNAPLGFLAGMAILDGEESLDISTVSVSHNSTIVGTSKSVGGLIGLVITNPNNRNVTYEGSSISAASTHFVINLNKVTIPDAINLLSTGYKGNATGGISSVGMLPNNYPGYTGGIIGEVTSYNSNYYTDVNFTGTTLVRGEIINTDMGSGGVIGHINNKVCVKFDGDVDVSEITQITGSSTTYYRGTLIGSIAKYGMAYMTEGHSVTYPIIDDLKVVNETDVDYVEQNYTKAATVYKNTSDGFFAKEIKISGDGTKDNPYILSSAEDVERLSVLLTTYGRYGTWYAPLTVNNKSVDSWESWFEIPDSKKGSNGEISYTNICNYVRQAYFLITADIDLSERNIVRLNRNSEAAFAGSIEGLQGSYGNGNEYPTLTYNVTDYQGAVALIPYATGRLVDAEPVACEFKNFNLEGTLEGRTEVHGLISSLTQSNTAYSNYIFENININLDLNQKLSNAAGMSGLIGTANYDNVTNDLTEGLKLVFKDITFNGSMLTNSNGNSYGGGLAGYIYIPSNDMTNTEDINRFEIIVDNYDFSGEVKSTSVSGFRVAAMINLIGRVNNSKGYKSYAVAGRSVNFGKTADVIISNVNIHDSEFVNGDGSGEMCGVLGNSWAWADAELTDISLSNVVFDTMAGYGAVLLTSNSSTINVDGLTYDNVSTIRRAAGNVSYWNSMMLYNNYGGVFVLKNHQVNNSKFITYDTNRVYFSENFVNTASYDSTRRVETHGIYSLEGEKTAGVKYSAINTYESPYIYTDLATETKDCKSKSYVGGSMQYNLYSNIEGDYISGTGTEEDPFILDSEEDMLVFSNVFTRMSATTFYEYFKDVDEIITDDTIAFTERRATIAHRILTGVYVLAADIDLTEYSYYTANNFSGKFYGFDAYGYSGKTALTDDELKSYASSAIAVLEGVTSSNGITLDIANSYKPEVKFGADKVAGGVMTSTSAAGGDGFNKPCSNYGIHKNMQSGIFGPIVGGASYYGSYNRCSDVKISNLLLTGVVSSCNVSVTNGGGAFLVTGCDYYTAIYEANVDIEHIDFKDAFITQRTNTASNWDQGSGLLVDTIYNSDVNISNIKILKDENGAGNIRADALIGYQYGTSSKVIFRDIDLNAVIDPGTLSVEPTTVEGEIVNVVKITTTEAEGQWREPTKSGYDTYGYGFRYGYYYFYLKEGAAIYYYDVGTDVVTPGRYDKQNVQTIQNKVLLRDVQKYAYKVINVDVNPANANITQGSGTEDDPYIIDNVGQLLTLANFIKYEGDVIDYEDWWVGDISGTGYDADDTDTWADNGNILYKNRYISDTEDYRIQAVKHLASSYYKVVADIDFTVPDGPFSEMSENFNGIGTSTYPFCGGFIGEEKADGTYPSIIIGRNGTGYQKTFGLIQYGKGIEVKNLNFENGYVYEETVDTNTGVFTYTRTDEKNRIYLSNDQTTAGIVAAYITGGDNIIDNVNINVQIQKSAQNDSGSTFCVGGYVGRLTNGTLKVSGIDEDTFANFNIGVDESMTPLNYDAIGVNTYNRYVSAIAGRVDSAYIVYDDNGTMSSDIITINTERVTSTDADGNIICEVPEIGYYNKYGIGCSRSYNPINQSYLDSIDRIKVIYDTRDDKEGMLIAQIENEDQLFLYSIALGSGALSSYSAGTYTPLSSCKKDEEEWTEWLALENEGKDADSQIVLTDDYNFPAVFKYFDFRQLEDSYKSTIYNGCSMLNMVNSVYQNGTTYRTTWMLSENKVYDMTGFGDAFTGIGTRLHTDYDTNTDGSVKYTALNANFNGNGSTIKVAIENDYSAGLFSVLNTENSSNSPFFIENFTLEGSVIQTEKGKGSVGGVAALARYGWYTFKDINLKNLEIINKSTSGTSTSGILGSSLYNNASVRFYNINIGDADSDEADNVLISAPNTTSGAAGLIYSTTRLIAEDINITNTTISGGGSVGGLVAALTNQHGNATAEDVVVENCTFETRTTTGSVGPVIGYISAANTTNYVALHNIAVKDNNLIAPEGNNRVGRVVGAHTGTNYCKKEILNLTDKNSDDFTGPTSDVVWNCEVTSQYEDCDYIYYNDFCDLEKAEELYDIDRTAVDSNGNPVVRYDECLEDDLFTAPDADNDGVGESLDLITDTDYMDNTIIKWTSDSGTLENVINSVLNTLTNGTGLLNDGNNDKITVTVESLQVNNGVITPREDDTLSIIKRDGQFLVTNNNKYDSFEKDDSKTGEHIPGTFSLIHIKYTVGNNTYTEEITIPIFVSNMVNVDIYSKLVIGEEYDVDVLRAIKRTSADIQVTTKNSTYTVYTEFMYSSNRIDFDEELYMNKGFRLYDAPDPYVALGTKLTLIDLTFEDDPKVYYYEVEASDTFIPLAWFKDENGVSYTERNINQLDRDKNGLPQTRSYTTMYVNQRTFKKYNRGIEKYLLIVDCSDVAQIGNETSFSPIIMDGVQTGQDDILNKEVFYIKYRTYNTLSTYNGRTVQFVEDSVVTEGEINKDKQLYVEVEFTDTATEFYWSDIKPYDYINQNKYLEVVAYLKNENGDKIMLPSGTRIKCNNADAIYEGIKNTSAIFYYKDVMEDEKYAMLEQTGNTTTKVSFSLDFTYAKMEKLPSGNYTICFDLVRNFNPEYPMGDDLLDTIESDVIEVTANAEYGFRLETYGKDSLAFNIADVAEGTDSVVNFSVLMNSTLPEALARNKQIKIKFTLYKKDKDTGVYMPYLNTSDNELTDISLMLTYNGITTTKKLNSGDMEFTMSGITGIESEPVTLNAVMTIPYEADINNYKLYAEMYVDDDRRASDFFIVNISDIKH